MRKATLATVCGLVPALLLTACNDDAGVSSNRPLPPGASVPAAGGAGGTGGTGGAQPNAAGAAKLASTVALTPEEWTKGFIKDDPYEDNGVEYYAMDQACKSAVAKAPGTLLAMTSRNVKNPTPGKNTVQNLGWSSVTVWGGVADAQKDMQIGRADLKRCPNAASSDASTKWTNSHEVAPPSIQGVDEIYAEEGSVEYKGDTGGMLPYYEVVVRKGGVVLAASLDGASDASSTQLKVQVQGAITAMLMKLRTQAQS